MLKLDISDSRPAEYFSFQRAMTGDCKQSHDRFRSVSLYYDHVSSTSKSYCGCYITKKVAEKGSQLAASDGVFTKHRASFIISDDLQIFPNATGLLEIINILGITDMDKAEPIKVTMGFSEIMSLLKASLISPTPLSDVILNKTRKTNSVVVDSEIKTPHLIENQKNPNSKKIIVKVVVQKSSGKLLYAQAEEDFVEFLFSFFNIPVGGAEHLVAGKTCIKAIDNLYQSTSFVIDDKYFKTSKTKDRLMKPNLVHGCISEKHILPLAEEHLPAHYDYNLSGKILVKLFMQPSYYINNPSGISSVKFPKGQGCYLEGQTFKVTDDFTVTPFCTVSILSGLSKLQIPISDVEEVELQIGFQEALSILKASLTSTSALSDALLNNISIKQPKP